MTIVFAVPTGYHARELLMPLKDLLAADPSLTRILCFTPAAAHRDVIFPDYPPKFEFRQPLDSAEAYQQLFVQEPVNLVITDTTGLDPYDAPLLEGGKAAGIPTLTFIASWDNVWKIRRSRLPQVAADYFVVWNTMMKEHLLTIFKTVQPEHIAVIGAPRLDYFYRPALIPSRQQLFEKLGLGDSAQPLLHLATTELYPSDYVVKDIRLAQQRGQLPDALALLTSVHPGGRLENHQSLASYGATVRYAFGRHTDMPHPDFLYNPTPEDIYDAVALYTHADILINHSSTTAIESMAGQTPVITIAYGKPWDWLGWRRSIIYRDFREHYQDVIAESSTAVVHNRQQLTAAIRRYLGDPTADAAARQRTLQKITTNTNGTAAQEFFAHIKSLI